MNFSRFASTLARLPILFIAVLCPYVACADESLQSYDIEAQPMDRALKAFAAQTEIQVAFAPETVEGLVAQAVEGDFVPESALQALIDESGLDYEFASDRLVVVHAPHTNDQGGDSDSGNVRPRPVLMAQNQTSQAQTTSSNTEQNRREEDPSLVLEEIVVVGTYIRGSTPAGAPVIAFDRAMLDATGLSTVEEFMRRLPQNFGGGGNDITTAATVSSRGNANLNSARGSGINLRGLGTESTLTVINGRRVAPNASETLTDISLIPLSAIERIEVLPDGASAIYGSDAVGGVVNVVLRNNYQGAETRLRYGSVTDGSLDEVKFSQAFGFGWESGGLVLVYDYLKREPLFSSERSFAASTDLRPLGGDDSRDQRANPGTLIAGGQTFAIPAGQNGTALTPADLVAGSRNLGNFREGTTLLDERQQHSVFVEANQSIGGSTKLYGELRFADRKVDPILSADVDRLSVPDSNPFFVDPVGGLTEVDVDYSFIDDFGPREADLDTRAYSAILGLEFDVGNDWVVDVFASYSEEQLNSFFGDQANSFYLDQALADTDPTTAFNPFGDGSFTNPDTISQIEGFTSGETKSQLRLVNAKLDGTITNLPGGALRFAVGAEYFEWDFEGESLRFVSSQAPTLVLTDPRSRDVAAAFGELYIPIVGEDNKRPGVNSLILSLAGRYSEYSDFGDTFNPKYGVEYQPTTELAFRGTYGTSFRAPAVSQLDTTFNTPFFFPAFDPASPTLTTNSIILTGNNPDLQPEEATTWTAGIDYSPNWAPGLTAEFTYFDIEYSDRIGTAINFFSSIFLEPETFAPILTRDPDPSMVAPFFDNPFFINLVGSNDPTDVEALVDLRLTNLAVVHVDGFDFLLSYQFNTEVGEFGFNVNYSKFLTFDEGFTATAPLIDRVGQVGSPVDFRVRGGVSWSRGPWLGAAFVNHMDGYFDDVSDPQRNVDSYTTVDLRLGYEVSEQAGRSLLNGTSVALSIANVFDEDPPFFNHEFGIGFDPEKADPRGRFISFEIIKQWQ